jgi:hypothetical protein
MEWLAEALAQRPVTLEGGIEARFRLTNLMASPQPFSRRCRPGDPARIGSRRV